MATAMDDLREQIKFRGLKAGGFSDPVREFTGRLDGFDVVKATFNNVETGRNNVVLHFSELDDVQCSEGVYQFPVKDISLSYNDKDDTRWGIFAKSGLRFLVGDEEFKDLIGRRLHLKLLVHTIYQGKEKGQSPADCWEIVGVDGATSSSGHQSTVTGQQAIPVEKQLLLLLNGKTQQQFNMEALRLPAVKSNSTVTTKILNGTFFAEVTSNGLMQKDDTGVYALTPAGIESLQS